MSINYNTVGCSIKLGFDVGTVVRYHQYVIHATIDRIVLGTNEEKLEVALLACMHSS